jgi:putative tryptophan/tyrosine transport system substrate-binding protein
MRHLVHLLAFVALVLGLLHAHPTLGQSAPKVPRIGFLSPSNNTPTALLRGFQQGLKEHGYLEGRTIEVVYRWAHGRFDQLPHLAAELIALDVDVIVTSVTAASLAAKATTDTIPIVMIGVADPVGAGLVASLARPGGNLTGTSTLQANIAAKQLELVRVVDPMLSRVAILWNPANTAFQSLQVSQAHAAAQTLGLELHPIEATQLEDFPTALATLRGKDLRALVVLADPTYTVHRGALLEHAFREGLITICGNQDDAEAGCLISYGPSYFDAGRRAVVYVDRILKGARPGDLPVEQSTKFDLTVNLRTARALGLTLPALALSLADEVIE